MDFWKEVCKILKKEVDSEIKLETPSNPEFGDYSFPCFELAKKENKNPNIIAQELVKKIKLNKSINRIEVKGPYLNFFVNKNLLNEGILNSILKHGKWYGKGNKKGRVMVEFSQANTHKAFHVGHIRGTSFGESLSRIFEFNGLNVVRANYQGDVGMHVAKWIWCYNKYHKDEMLTNDENWVASIYVDAVKRLALDEKLKEEVEEINRKLDSREDKDIIKLWEKTRKLSLESLESIYKDLNTHFDRYYFESQVDKKGKEISKGLLKRGITEISNGATIVNLERYGLGVFLLLRSDSTPLYSGKDLYLAEKKFKDFKLSESIYIIGAEQKFYFKQLFKTLEISGLKDFKKLKVIHYDSVRLPTGKMSSRTGENILYSDFKKVLIEYAKKEIEKRGDKITSKELEGRALKIAIASIKYSMLNQDPNKIIIFYKEKALNFEGETGPYVQYAYARASSILRKSKLSKVSLNYSLLNHEKEISLIKRLGEFPDIIKEACEKCKPSLVTRYAYELSQGFNEFYAKCPCINANKELTKSRLILVSCTRQVIKNALTLLGIDVLERM